MPVKETAEASIQSAPRALGVRVAGDWDRFVALGGTQGRVRATIDACAAAVNGLRPLAAGHRFGFGCNGDGQTARKWAWRRACGHC